MKSPIRQTIHKHLDQVGLFVISPGYNFSRIRRILPIPRNPIQGQVDSPPSLSYPLLNNNQHFFWLHKILVAASFK